MTARRTLALALLLAVAGGGSVVVAQRSGADAVSTLTGTDGARPAPGAAADPADLAGTLPVGAPAPAVRAQGWLNTAPLTPADLRGRVVLYEFWTFGCVNCRNVQPYVKAWHARYAADGLVVVAVHTPEFGYEADPDAVRAYVEENGLGYPVALDPDGTVWRDFGNRYWPQFYLHDRDGRRRVVKIGEGGYDTTEDAIRALLGIGADAPRAVTP
ncbi:redoxin family protein [Kineosporia sp. R_H_3]|uniref:redoxin family protein n=1 Tax=Kineosporia sp. R_H_3 TaxID=1961848 RepID=UPI001304137A|nr:redoxin family protein [Kineosporia sp. R_H_3]